MEFSFELASFTYERVRGEKHFPADAFVGTGIGWLTGWQVYRAHHNTVEAPLTDTVSTNGAGRYIYWDNYYHDLYTNRNFLMGDWVGRDGSGVQAWSRYWLSPKNSIQPGYRHLKVDNKFIPNGGAINDASVRADYWIRRQWALRLLSSMNNGDFHCSPRDFRRT